MTWITNVLCAAGVSTMVLLAACSPEAVTATSASNSASADADAGTNATTQGGPGGNAEQMAEIEACLKEAGIEDKMPQRPEGGDGSQPQAAPPTGQPPADGERQAGGPFADEEVQAALKECGIDLPEPPSGGGPQGG